MSETETTQAKTQDEEAQVEEVDVELLQIKLDNLQKDLQAKNEECDKLRALNSKLELDVVEANMKRVHHSNESNEVQRMKSESEEVLTKAKALIFEKMKIIKNQELQIDALNAQVASLRDVVGITKNMLEIRNIEVKHLQDQIDKMNLKVGAEKERQDLVHAKLDKMIRMNAELKREYETQLVLFNALRDRYSERELAKGVVADLKESIQNEKKEQVNGTESTENN